MILLKVIYDQYIFSKVTKFESTPCTSLKHILCLKNTGCYFPLPRTSTTHKRYFIYANHAFRKQMKICDALGKANKSGILCKTNDDIDCVIAASN